jgi:hypothetical protein
MGPDSEDDSRLSHDHLAAIRRTEKNQQKKSVNLKL